jgi:hypothetical protein
MSMDQFLAEFYATNKTAAAEDVGAAEDLEKQAQVALFVKTAAREGIDLEQLEEGQVEELFGGFVAKLAGEPPPFAKKDDKDDGDKDDKKDDDKDEKKAAAERELSEKRAAAEKMAEADTIGRTIAHAFVHELAEIEKSAGAADKLKNLGNAAGDKLKTVKMVAKNTAERGGELLSGSKAKNLSHKAETAIRQAGSAKERGSPLQKNWQNVASRMAPAAAKEEKNVRNARIGAGVAAGTAVGGGAYAATRKKESSAIDELAIEVALAKVAEAGWNVEEAAQRVDALYTLDLVPESEKIAGANDLETAVDLRALEILEAASYPVEWTA